MSASHEVFQRYDGLGDDVPGPFEARTFAQRVASGRPPPPAPIVKFRRSKIREVRGNAPA